MPEMHQLLLFLAAAGILAITPGPGILYVLTRTLGGGKRAGILSALGTFIGGLVHVLAAAIGLSAILAASAIAFAIVKYTGAAYLIYLGIRMFRSPELRPDFARLTGSDKNLFVQGVATEVLNPKTALFFLSFIPQFVNPHSGSVFMHFILLGSNISNPEHPG